MLSTNTQSRMVKTPVHKIPIGEAFKGQDGHYTLRIKKSKGKEMEEVPLDKLLSMVVSVAEAE